MTTNELKVQCKKYVVEMDISANDMLKKNQEPSNEIQKQVYEWVGMERITTPESTHQIANFNYDIVKHSCIQSGEHEIDMHSKETAQHSVFCRSNICESINSCEEQSKCEIRSREEADEASDASKNNDASNGSTVFQKRTLKRNSLKAKNTSTEKSLCHKEQTHDCPIPLENDTYQSEKICMEKVTLRVNQEANNLKNDSYKINNICKEKPTFTCDKCKKMYSSKIALVKHTKYHSAETTILCKICGDRFEAQDQLTIHLKKHKSSEFKCEVCSKKFSDQAKLNSHLRVHGKGPPVKMDKQFLCDVCSKTFASRTGLGFHLRTHTGYKPYTCQYCSKGFTISSNKIRHERTHTGDKHFVCHFCSIAFASSNGLKYHLTIHTGETNYHCQTCGKSFTRLKYLKEHNFTHTGEKPFKCKICSASYGNSGSLFAHEKKCKAQYSTCLIESNKCSSRESQYIQNQGSNAGILYSKIHGQPQHELQFPYNQEIPPISYLLPPQNPSPPDVQYQTSHHLVSTIRPAAVSAGTWCFKWSDAT